MFLFMVGALALSFGELLKMQPSSKFVLRGWVDLDELLHLNSALQNSPWMQNIKKAQADLLQTVEAFDGCVGRAQSTFVSCVGDCCCHCCSPDVKYGLQGKVNEKLDAGVVNQYVCPLVHNIFNHRDY